VCAKTEKGRGEGALLPSYCFNKSGSLAQLVSGLESDNPFDIF
jgi:hypothetical protein